MFSADTQQTENKKRVHHVGFLMTRAVSACLPAAPTVIVLVAEGDLEVAANREGDGNTGA